MSNARGVPLTSEQKEFRRAEYRKLVLDFFSQTGKSPRMVDIPYAYKILKVYDTWNEFIEDCGLEVNRVNTDVEKDALTYDYKELAKKLGRTPYSSEFYEKLGRQGSIRKFFGSWNEFVDICETDFNRVTGTEKEELVQRVLNLAKELGRTPTTREFNQQAKEGNLCTTMVIRRHFGSWTECLEYCGLEPNVNRDFVRRKKKQQINGVETQKGPSES